MVRQLDVIPGSLDAPELHEQLVEANRRLARSRVVSDELQQLAKSLVEHLLQLSEDEPEDAGIFVRQVLRKGARETLEGLLADDDQLKRRHLRLGFEQMRQALNEILEDRPVHESRKPGDLARWMVQVTRVPQREVADVLGVPERTFQRWLTKPTTRIRSEEELKLRVAAKCINQLRHGLTGRGIVNWFHHRHPDLKKTPTKALNELERNPDYEPLLVRLAASSRYSGGT